MMLMIVDSVLQGKYAKKARTVVGMRYMMPLVLWLNIMGHIRWRNQLEGNTVILIVL